MHVTHLVSRLGRNDAKLIGRDRMLLVLLAFVVYISAVLRYGLPWANTYLAEHGILPGENVAHPLADYYPLIVAFLAFYSGAQIMGTIMGFVFLDEKDDNSLQALLVTPLPFHSYMGYRIGLTTVVSLFIIAAMVLFINQALIPIWQLFLISAGAALTAPILMLFFAITAENKVQGFAMGKFVGIGGWVILGGWFVAEPVQWLFGLFPPFWVSKAYWMILEGRSLWWLALLIGILSQAILIAWLMRRFKRVAYR